MKFHQYLFPNYMDININSLHLLEKCTTGVQTPNLPVNTGDLIYNSASL